MKLVVDESKMSLGELDKRQRVHGWALRYVCPECGLEGERDYGDSYLSYPEPNSFKTLVLYCGGRDGCGHEWTAGKIRVDLGLTVVDMDAAPVVVERVGTLR